MAYINYIILDAARMGTGINTARSFGDNFLSLFSGKSESELADVAPYIFAYNPKSKFADWFMDEGWGKGWGIMLRSGVTIEELHSHCRKFLVKENETGQEIYFRYYDPRVLSIFLPTCSPEQLKEFFGPIDYIMIEDIDPNYAQLIWLENYKLYMKAIGKEELLKRFRAHDPYTGEQFDNTEQLQPNHTQNGKVAEQTQASQQPPKSNEAKPQKQESSPQHHTKNDMMEIENAKKWKEFFFD